MTKTKPAPSTLAEAVHGPEDDLADIALLVVGFRRRPQSDMDKTQIERVVGKLNYLAAELHEGRQRQLESPTAKELEKQLARIASLADKLSKAIHALPKLSKDLLNLVYHAQSGWDEAGHAPVDLGLGAAPTELVISAVHQAAKQQVDSCNDDRILGPTRFNRPGPEKAAQRVLGDPRLFLADQVAQLIGREQGIDAITSEENGPVYEVVGRLWNHVTGLEDDGANLRQYVRRGVRSAKLKREWQAALDEGRRCREELYRKPSNVLDQQIREDMSRHIQALDAQALDLSARAHAALWDYGPDTRLDTAEKIEGDSGG